MSDSEDKAKPTVKPEEGDEKKNGDGPKAADAKKADADVKEEKPDAKAVTAAELRKRITAILKEADLEKTSAKKVRIWHQLLVARRLIDEGQLVVREASQNL